MLRGIVLYGLGVGAVAFVNAKFGPASGFFVLVALAMIGVTAEQAKA